MPFADGRIRCVARPPPSGRRGCAPSRPAPRASTRPRWPPRSPTPGGGSPSDWVRWSAAASRNRDVLAAERQQRAGRDGRGPRRGQRAGRPDRHAHRVAAPRRGGQGAGGAAHRAARADGARAVRDGRRRSGRRIRPAGRAAADGARDGRVRAGPRARRAGDRAGADAVSTGPPRSVAPNAPNESWPSWAGSTRWRSRSSPRWRSATTSCPPSSRTSRPPARICSTSSPTSTPASCRCSPRPTPTWSGSSARCSPRCSPAARAGCCSPTPTTC